MPNRFFVPVPVPKAPSKIHRNGHKSSLFLIKPVLPVSKGWGKQVGPWLTMRFCHLTHLVQCKFTGPCLRYAAHHLSVSQIQYSVYKQASKKYTSAGCFLQPQQTPTFQTFWCLLDVTLGIITWDAEMFTHYRQTHPTKPNVGIRWLLALALESLMLRYLLNIPCLWWIKLYFQNSHD